MNTALIKTQMGGFGADRVENLRIALVEYTNVNKSGGLVITRIIKGDCYISRISPDKVLKYNATVQDYDIISNIVDEHNKQLQILRQEATNSINAVLKG